MVFLIVLMLMLDVLMLKALNLFNDWKWIWRFQFDDDFVGAKYPIVQDLIYYSLRS